MKKMKIGITLTEDAVEKLDKLRDYLKEEEGVVLSKSQVISRLINLEYSEKEAKVS